MLKKWIALLVSSAFVLAACHSPVYNQTAGNVADVKIRAAAARHKSDNDGKPLPPLVVKSGLYVDTTPVNLERMPSWMHNHIVIRGDQLPFSYYSRTVALGARSSVLTKYQTGLDPAINISMSYSGTVKGALDLLSAKTGYVYSIHGSNIYWQAFVVKTFDVAFMPGSSDYLMGKKGGGGGANTSQQGSSAQTTNYVTSDNSNDEYSNIGGKLSVWKDLESTIGQLMSPDGKVTVSQATTSVTVRDRPSNVHLVGQYIANLNSKLSRQVLIKIQVLEVTLENDYDFGINWDVVARAFHNSPFQLSANYGTPVAITAFSPQSQTNINGAPQFGVNPNAPGGNPNGIPSYNILFNALNQQGKTSVVTEPRAVSLNNQVSVIRIVNQEGYVASVQNTTLAGSTGGGGGASGANNTVTSQVTPGLVITGLTLYILPKIMGNKVYLQVNADLSTNNGFTTFKGSNSIQLPQITEKHFNQRSMICSGDTLILSGFRQVSNSANAMQLLTSQALGGKGASQINKETVVLITPIILNNGLA